MCLKRQINLKFGCVKLCKKKLKYYNEMYLKRQINLIKVD